MKDFCRWYHQHYFCTVLVQSSVVSEEWIKMWTFTDRQTQKWWQKLIWSFMSVELRITTPLPHSTYTHVIIASKNIE